MRKKAIVIGGGFAGLTASSYLVKNNYQVTLLESSPKLGGRAYSFQDKETNTIIDNGADGSDETDGSGKEPRSESRSSPKAD